MYIHYTHIYVTIESSPLRLLFHSQAHQQSLLYHSLISLIELLVILFSQKLS